MLPAMHRRGLLVGALLSLAHLAPIASASTVNAPSIPNLKAGPSSKLSTTCYFGEPSESCIFSCNQESMEAYCDEEKKQCVCRPSENKPEIEPEEENVDNIEEPQVTEISPTDAPPRERPQTNFKLSDFCMFGYPSPACVLNCKTKKMKGYCEDDLGICVCRNPSLDEGISMDWFALLQNLQGSVPAGPQDVLDLTGGMTLDWMNLLQQLQIDDSGETQEPFETTIVSEPDEDLSENKNDMVYYVFDLDSLINTNDSVSSNDTNVSTPAPRSSGFTEVGKIIEGWDIHHVMAVITLVFIGGLVLLEISYCFKKPKTDTQMPSIFPTKK